MSEKQKNTLYAAITVIVLIFLFRPFGNLGWDEVRRFVALLLTAIAVGAIVWGLLKKKKY